MLFHYILDAVRRTLPPRKNSMDKRVSKTQCQAERSIYHCKRLKAHYEKTKGSVHAKREQHTSVPMSFWKLIQEMIEDDKVHNE